MARTRSISWRVRFAFGGLAAAFALVVAVDLVSLIPRSIPALDEPPRAESDEARWDVPVRVGFVTTAIAEVRGHRVAQGLGWPSRRVALRAAVIEHPRGVVQFGAGIDEPGDVPGLGSLIVSPLSDARLVRSVADAYVGELTPTEIILPTARWYNLGGLRSPPAGQLVMSWPEIWSATDGPWPRRYAIEPRRFEPFASSAAHIRWVGGGPYGARRHDDRFEDGSVVAIPLKGSAAQEVALLLRLGSGRNLLLVGDALWSEEQLDGLHPRPPWMAWFHDRNPMRLARTYRWLASLRRATPPVEVVSLMDGEADLPEWPETWE